MGKLLRQTSLTVKQVVLTFLVVLVVGGGVTLAQSWYSLGVERTAAEARIRQLADSALDNAAAAAFRLDEDLADYVTTGLAIAPEVSRAAIRDENGDLLASQENAEQARAPAWLQDLAYRDLSSIEIPLYGQGRADLLVGSLVIEPDRNALANAFLASLRTLVALDAAKAVFLALALSVLFYSALTRPLLALVESVKQVSPGVDRKLANVQPLRSQEDELGNLVQSVDEQLLMFRQLLEERGALLKDLQLRDAALDAMDSGLLLVDTSSPAMPVVDENAAIADMLGQPAGSMMGRSIIELFENVGPARSEAGTLREFVASAMAGPGTSAVYEFDAADEQTRLYTVSIVPVQTGADEATHRAIIVNDVTRARETEEKLRHAQKMDALGKVAGGIAHDFNNTLAVMKGNLELASLDFAGQPAVLEFLQPIARSVDRASELTGRLLRFSRKAPIHASNESVDLLIAQMRDMLARSLTPRIQIKLELDAADAEVRIDRGDFEDALLNLAVNARDAMPGGGTLTLRTWIETLTDDSDSLREGMAGGRFVCLQVADTGTGIEPAVQKRLFEPFFTTKEAQRGTGLGLSQVYGFVERSGGNIRLASTPGSGSEFTIFLPLSSGDSASTAATEPPQTLAGGDETILLVDDERDLLDTARRMLARLGYRVVATSSAAEAMALFAERADEIDLLLSDVVMPGGMNGYELADRLRAERPDLPVLMTSGFDSKREDRAQYPLLAKPYSAGVMADAVRRVLDGGANT